MTNMDLILKVRKKNIAHFDYLYEFIYLYHCYNEYDFEKVGRIEKDFYEHIDMVVTSFFESAWSTSTRFWFKYFTNFFPDRDKYFKYDGKNEFSFYCKSKILDHTHNQITVKNNNDPIPINVLEILLGINNDTVLIQKDQVIRYKVIKGLHSDKQPEFEFDIFVNEDQILSYIFGDDSRSIDFYRNAVKDFMIGNQTYYFGFDDKDIDAMIIKL